MERRLGDTLALGKHDADALAAREQALALDGSDLSLRRTVERSRTGKEVLADYAIDGRKALKAFDARGSNVEGSSVLVVDAAATGPLPMARWWTAIHIVQKALDQARCPGGRGQRSPGRAGARAADHEGGRHGARAREHRGKDTVSLPGVRVGDDVELEYLLAHPARARRSPGFTASAFYSRWPACRTTGPRTRSWRRKARG